MRLDGIKWRKILKRLTVISACLGVTVMAGGCETKEDTMSLSGNIQLVGSTSMEELCVALSESYMEKNPNVSVSAEYIGSTGGIEALLAGSADIGTSSRNLTQDELDQGAVENIVAKDGIAVIISPTVTGIEGLTSQQIIDIYLGDITNWSEVGGPDMPIVTIGHEAGSGTRDPFEEILGIVDQCNYANEMSGSGPVITKVGETEGSIGYCSSAIVDDVVKVLSVDGVKPTKENIQNGTYSMTKPMVMATMGEISEQDELIQDFFDFVYSDEGVALTESVNLIPISKE